MSELQMVALGAYGIFVTIALGHYVETTNILKRQLRQQKAKPMPIETVPSGAEQQSPTHMQMQTPKDR